MDVQEAIDSIIEKISFSRKDKFAILLGKTLEEIPDPEEEDFPRYKNIMFKQSVLYKGFSPWNNEHGKDKKYESGVEALSLICDELGLDIDKSECFILFHIRDLGKFRLREDKLLSELKPLWGQYKHYKLDDGEFSYALKNLMRNNFIKYRKRNLHLNPSLLVRIKL